MVGSFLNDFYLSVVLHRAEESHWKTTSNVFEGGSDHEPFLWQKIPAVLSWQFPDHYYHSSLDDTDKISPAEMRNAGIAMGTAALALAYDTDEIAEEVFNAVKDASVWRIENEVKNSASELQSDTTRRGQEVSTSQMSQKEIITAWSKWYKEALQSVLRIPCTTPSSSLRDEVNVQIGRLREQGGGGLMQLRLD